MDFQIKKSVDYWNPKYGLSPALWPAVCAMPDWYKPDEDSQCKADFKNISLSHLLKQLIYAMKLSYEMPKQKSLRKALSRRVLCSKPFCMSGTVYVVHMLELQLGTHKLIKIGRSQSPELWMPHQSRIRQYRLSLFPSGAKLLAAHMVMVAESKEHQIDVETRIHREARKRAKPDIFTTMVRKICETYRRQDLDVLVQISRDTCRLNPAELHVQEKKDKRDKHWSSPSEASSKPAEKNLFVAMLYTAALPAPP